MEPRWHTSRPGRVLAMQVSEAGAMTAALWCRGYVSPAGVAMPRPGGRLVCPFGSWLARGEDGMFSVMADDDFRRRYEPEGERPRRGGKGA